MRSFSWLKTLGVSGLDTGVRREWLEISQSDATGEGKRIFLGEKLGSWEKVEETEGEPAPSRAS